MKYSVANIDCQALADWQIDLLTQELADLGFDSFEQDGSTLRAYIPTDLVPTLDHSSVHSFIRSFESCPDENWNAAWEASHEVEELPLGVRITPHCAFGAGHHETTSMMISELLSTDLAGKSVFDHGTGTGVLAIFAAKLGATHVLATDIDENSVSNAIENASANNVSIDVRLGATVPAGTYDLILANIHRNILIEHMPAYARNLTAGGELWLSGFYEADIPALIQAAANQNLHHIATRQNGDWRMLIFRK